MKINDPASACMHSSPACPDCAARFEFRVRRARKELAERQRCPRCGRELLAHITTQTRRCESCRVTYASDGTVREAAKRVMAKHGKSLKRLADRND